YYSMNFIFSSVFKKITLFLGVAFLVGSVIFFAWPGFAELRDDLSIHQNSLIRHFSPAWRSVKRIADLPYVLFYSLRGTNLPVYEITISKSDKEVLAKAALRGRKKTVKGAFRANNYITDDAHISELGLIFPYQNAVKKSWRIQLPEEQPLGERNVLYFVLPEEKGWVFGAVNAMHARELGLISPELSYVRLHVNKTDMGVYLLVEGWEESMLEKNGRGLGPIFSNNAIARGSNRPVQHVLVDWEDQVTAETPAYAQESLAYFLDLVTNAPDDVFRKALPYIVDMDMWYRWMVLAALSGEFPSHYWFVNPADGKLEPVAFDFTLTDIETPLQIRNNLLVSRVLQVPEFSATFSALLRGYLSDTSHKERALASYDEIFKNIKRDMLIDTKKIQTSDAVLDRIALERNIISHNYDALLRMITESGIAEHTEAPNGHVPARMFDVQKYEHSFLAWNNPLFLFLAENPQIQFRGGNELIIPAGTHIFRKTVVVPAGYTLIIEPGAHFLLAPDVSMFSYSAVESKGIAYNPVFVRALDPKKPWGVFAVLNAPGMQTFTHTHFADGSDATFAGIYFSGMLSVQRSDLNFQHGSISRSHADDGIHVHTGNAFITDSIFAAVSSDGIDIDFAGGDESRFERNAFREIGGDAIDISFSRVAIRENEVTGCGDKGVSVGEASMPLIEKNTIMGCVYGIAVKDNSHASLAGNLLLGNGTGLGLYRKKPHFVHGGYADVRDSIIWNNETQISTDTYSSVTVEQSVIQDGFAGRENTSEEPRLKTMISAELYHFLQAILMKKNE
ncbi:MAG: hypothetical protein G01um101470_613, partial [Parcubacteria group bacterium Gr01-1014_70]